MRLRGRGYGRNGKEPLAASRMRFAVVAALLVIQINPLLHCCIIAGRGTPLIAAAIHLHRPASALLV